MATIGYLWLLGNISSGSSTSEASFGAPLLFVLAHLLEALCLDKALILIEAHLRSSREAHPPAAKTHKRLI